LVLRSSCRRLAMFLFGLLFAYWCCNREGTEVDYLVVGDILSGGGILSLSLSF